MSGYRQLTDWNFDGWSNQDLAAEVQKLNSSTVTAEFSEASAALRDLAGKLDAADTAVQAELRRLSIHWGGSAAEKGQSQTKVVADDLNDGSQASQQNSKAITQQGESTSTARYSTPPSQDLRGDTEQNFGDKVAGFIGIETDHAAEVEATNRARQQAIDSLNGYVSGSQGSLDGFRAPNQPPDMVVSSAAVSPSMSSSVGQPQVGAPGVPGGPGFTGTPGSPGSPGVPLGATPGITGGGVPGNTTGILPGATPGGISGVSGLPKPIPVPSALNAALTAGASGLAGATGSARPPTVVGGGRGPSQAPKTPIAPAGPKGAPSTIGGGKAGGGGAGGGAGAGAAGTGAAGKGPGGAMTPGGASGVGPEANRAGAGAAGKGGVAGKGSGSLMSPAASAARGDGEEDGEHVRKYGVDSDEMFGDDRMVVQSVIGEDPKDQ